MLFVTQLGLGLQTCCSPCEVECRFDYGESDCGEKIFKVHILFDGFEEIGFFQPTHDCFLSLFGNFWVGYDFENIYIEAFVVVSGKVFVLGDEERSSVPDFAQSGSIGRVGDFCLNE